jgi:hypothetical protein
MLLWYTPSLFSAAGGQKLLLLLLGVDVTLGPIITLVIYNSLKSRKAILFDFSVIATIQLLALFYGMFITFQARPVFIAFTQDSFTIATANQITDEHLAKSTYPEFSSLPLTGPIYVYAEMPNDVSKRNEIAFFKAAKMGLETFPQYFKPYSENKNIVGQASIPISQLIKLNKDRVIEINNAIAKSGRIETEIGFLPLKGMNSSLTLLIGKNDGEVLGVLQI